MTQTTTSTSARPHAAGFTLIELLIVVAIVGILAAVAMPAMKNAPQKAREAVLKEDLYQMRSSIDQFLGDRGYYPASLDALVEAGYLRRVPVDPITKSSDTWIITYAEGEENEGFHPPDEEGGGPGVLDIQSGADGSTLDGIPYSQL